MVRTQQIANLLNGKLNTIAAAKGVNKQFKLKAHLGKTDGGNIINGILKPTTGTPYEKGGTGSGTNGAVATYVASLIFPTSIDNSFATIVEDIVATLIEQEHGGSFTINGGKAVWEMTYGVPEGFDIRDVVGSSMPISFTVKLSFGSTGLLNGIKAWSLDGQPIPYVKEAVILNRYGKTISIDEAKDQQTIPTAQAKQFKFTMPYDSTNVVCTTLKNDILTGAFTKTYQLTYNDGAVQFTKTVTLYANGDTGTNGTGENTILTVSFVEAGGNEFVDADGNTIRYQIALVNWDFSDTSENTLYFASQSAQQTFMANLATDNASSNWMSFNAPSLNNVLETTVEVQRNLAVNPDKVMNYNYAIIRKQVFDGEDVLSSTEYSYYFVSQATAGAFGMVSLALKMDTIQTYLFNPNIEFADCMIERACLNRWVELENDSTRVRFDTHNNKALLLDEPQIGNCEKTCTSFDDIKFRWTGNDDIDTWLNNNIAYWVYAFVPGEDTSDNGYITDTDHPASKIARSNTGISLHPIDGSIYNAPYGCFSYPVYKGDNKIKVEWENLGTTNYYDIKQDNFKSLVERNNLSSVVFSLKASMMPPLGQSTQTYRSATTTTAERYQNIYIDNNGDLIIPLGSAGTTGYFSLYNSERDECCRITSSGTPATAIMLFTAPQQLNTEYQSFSVEYINPPTFSKSTIIAANKNQRYNPKLLQSKFEECKIRDVSGFSYSYDMEQLTASFTENGNTTFLYTESIQPEITRYCCRIAGQPFAQPFSIALSGIYSGLIGSIDTSLAFGTDNYAQFIANNRNYWLQTLLGFGQTIGTTALATGLGVATPLGLAGGAIGTISGVTDKFLNKSNLENSPASIRNTGGNILSNLQINKLNMGIEIWSAFGRDIVKANDFMFMNGFYYNQLDNPLNYIHTRKYFNYIKADITDILGLPLSNIIRADIQQRFSNGLRFWNVDTYQQYGLQYEKENYELWLEG